MSESDAPLRPDHDDCEFVPGTLVGVAFHTEATPWTHHAGPAFGGDCDGPGDHAAEEWQHDVETLLLQWMMLLPYAVAALQGVSAHSTARVCNDLSLDARRLLATRPGAR